MLVEFVKKFVNIHISPIMSFQRLDFEQNDWRILFMSKKKHIKIIKTGTKTELKTYFTESLLFQTCNPITQILFQEI